MEPNEISGIIVDAAMKVHSALGPGLLESAYEACLCHELRKRGTRCQIQVALPVVYDGQTVDLGYRIDLLVEDIVIVELKTVSALAPIHEAQIISYLRLSGKPIGLLINFHELHLKNGIRRFVNKL
jgi:GxxExxY protein